MKSSCPNFRAKRGAFSLVEVVVAVGVFAIAIVSVIGILAGVGRSVSDVGDADKAARLVGVIQARLQAVAFDDIRQNLVDADDVSVDFPTYDPSAETVVSNTRVFFASEDGSIVAPYAATTVWGQNGAITDKRERDGLKYFELTLIRNETLSDPANDSTAGFLAFNIRVRWPAFLPNGQPLTDQTQKNTLIIPAAVTR